MSHPETHQEFADLLRLARRAAGLTQAELAARSGLSERGISDLERGVRRTPRRQTLERLMHVLQVPDAERPAWRQRRWPASHPTTTTHRGPSAAMDGDQPAAARGDVPLTGREREVILLRRAFERIHAGAGGAVVLVGDPGIGKTRLAQELADFALQHRGAVYWGRCSETEGAPAYWPWIQVVRSWLLQYPIVDLQRDLQSDAAVIAQIVPEVRERLAGLPRVPATPPDQARFRLFDSIAMWLRRVASRMPLVLIFDDLHWADIASLRLLELIAARLHELRLLIVITYRDFEMYARPALSDALDALNRQPAHVSLHLRGLDESGIARIVEQLNGEIPSSELAAELHRQTDGNPFFVIEMARLLGSDATWPSDAGGTARAIPGSVREAIRRRVGALSAPCQALLSIAAVLGRDVSLPLLRSVVGQPFEQLLDLLDEAADAHIVERLDPTGHTRFVHALINETIYADLTTTRRLRLHADVAATLEQIYAGDLETHAGDIGRHFRLAAALGYAERAIDYAVMAARRAMAQAAWETAIDHYEHALSMIDLVHQPEDRQRCELLLELGEAQNVAAGLVGSASARATFDRAAGLAYRLAAPDLYARAALGYAGFNPLVTLGGVRQVDLLETALGLLGDTDHATTARVQARLAVSLMGRALGQRRDIARAATLSNAAVAMTRRIDDRETLVYALLMWHVAHADPDDLDARLAVTDEAVRIATTIGDPLSIAGAHELHCNNLLDAGAMDEAERGLQLIQRIAGDLRHPGLEWSMLNRRVVRDLYTGQLASAEATITQLVEGWDAATIRAPLWQLFFLRREQGRLSEIAADMRVHIGATDDLFQLAFILILDFETGHSGAARAVLGRIPPEQYQHLSCDAAWLLTLALHAEISYLADDVERARVLLDLLAPYAGRNVGITGNLYLGALDRFLGLLAITRRDWDAAGQHLSSAIAINTRLGMPPYVAHTRYACAEMLARRRERTDRSVIVSLLAQVLASAQEMGMHALQARATSLMELHGHERAGSGMSRREREVLRLLVEGRSDREIATALFISPYTVMRHVSNILGKLGVTSRTAAATLAVREGLV
jgi:DNA-binding NarL/FixJ family response regulator/transcriptional regulator with XRE-family HTH domain